MATQSDIDMENTRAIQQNTEAIQVLTEYFLSGGVLSLPQIMTNKNTNERFIVNLYNDDSGSSWDVTKIES